MELLKFHRHIRNLYGEDLDPARTTEIQGITTIVFECFPLLHREFRARIASIGDLLP